MSKPKHNPIADYARFSDRLIGIVSPAAMLSRIKARMQADMLVRRHEAAGFGRRHQRENDQGSTANEAIGTELDILRRRSLSMLSNNGYAGRGQAVIANGIVGAGIQMSVRNVSEQLETIILNEWKEWTSHHQCDHDERETFAGLQQLVIRTVFATGEAIVRRRRMPNGMIQLQVQEGDYLDTARTELTTDGKGSYTLNGIQYSAKGKVQGYWLFDTLEHTGGVLTSFDSKLISVEDVIHVFYADRAGQKRGLPWARKVYMRLQDLLSYADAEMQAKIVSACNAAFVTNSQESLTGLTGSESYDDRLDRIEPGMITYLNPNEEVTFNTPAHHAGFEPFNAVNLREIASGLGISYESLTGDYSYVNFTSGRMGWIEMGREFTEKRERVAIYFLNRAFEWFMESLSLRGVIAMGLDDARKIRADWTPPRREMLDPVKESEGLRLQIAAGLISWQEAVRGMGGDPDDVTQEIAAALDLFNQLDFTPSWLIESKEIHELAVENEAKTVTAEAAQTSAAKK